MPEVIRAVLARHHGQRNTHEPAAGRVQDVNEPATAPSTEWLTHFDLAGSPEADRNRLTDVLGGLRGLEHRLAIRSNRAETIILHGSPLHCIVRQEIRS